MCFYRNGRQGRVEISDLLPLSLSLAEGNEKIGPLRFENKIRGAGSVGVNDSFSMNAKNTLGCSLPPSPNLPINLNLSAKVEEE